MIMMEFRNLKDSIMLETELSYQPRTYIFYFSLKIVI